MKPWLESDSPAAVLIDMTAQERIQWALSRLPGRHVLLSSFGAQSAVLLHMAAANNAMPVILVDTGYLFPETYRYVDELMRKLDLSIAIARAPLTSAFYEAKYGKEWFRKHRGYSAITKVAPLKKVLEEMSVGTWFSGVRRVQSLARASASAYSREGQKCRVYPLVDWTDAQVAAYMVENDLPQHPLVEKGYTSIGDWHSSSPGVQREECGIHNLETMS